VNEGSARALRHFDSFCGFVYTEFELEEVRKRLMGEDTMIAEGISLYSGFTHRNKEGERA